MKFLRVLLFIVLLLVVIGIVLGLTGPKELNVERSAQIDAPPEMVYSYVSSLEKLNSWSPWADRDPNMESTFEGEDGTIGAKHIWSGNKDVGSGEHELTKLDPHRRVETHLVFHEPWESEADAYLNLESDGGDGTVIQWGLHADNNFFERIWGHFMDIESYVGKDYEEGLATLKSTVEADMAKEYNGYTVQLVEMPARKFLARRDVVKWEDMESYYARHLPRLMGIATSGGAELDGMPCGLYYTWDEEKEETDMAAAIPVNEFVDGADKENVSLDAGLVLLIDFYGNYENLGAAHEAMEAYVEQFNLEPDAPVVEEYVTDPGTEPDESKWLTKIYYYL